MECRRLKREEINSLLKTAPDTEKRNLIRILAGQDAYDFFDKYSIDHFGIVNGRPIYLVALTESDDGTKEFWTVVNSDVKETFSLCKYCKRELIKWGKKHGDIYATMENVNDENIKWCLWLGFNIVSSNHETVTLCYKGG